MLFSVFAGRNGTSRSYADKLITDKLEKLNKEKFDVVIAVSTASQGFNEIKQLLQGSSKNESNSDLGDNASNSSVEETKNRCRQSFYFTCVLCLVSCDRPRMRSYLSEGKDRRICNSDLQKRI